VAEQGQGRALALAAQAGDQIGAPRLGLEQLALEARRRQGLREETLDRGLVAGRVDRVGLDQPAEQLDRRGAEALGNGGGGGALLDGFSLDDQFHGAVD
jgi:hypothetical protein